MTLLAPNPMQPQCFRRVSTAHLIAVGYVLLFAVAQTGFAQIPNGSTSTNRPNVVILYADDMGYGDLACQNPESKIKTPNLDELARTGIRFTDAHSSSGICTPSRYALLTGRYHWRAFHDIVNSFGPSVFRSEQITLSELLKSEGYATACVGKWHLGWNWQALMNANAQPSEQPGGGTGYNATDFDWTRAIPDGPLAHGFDYYFGDDVPNFPPYCWIENDQVVAAPTEPLSESPKTAEGSWECRKGPMVSGWQLDAVMPKLTEKAVEWIHSRAGNDQPFLLYVPFTSPHAPIVPSDKFQGSSQAGGYGDFMQQTDATVGEIIAALKDNDLYDNTLIIFTADNGPEIYALERLKNFEHSSMGSLRGIKRSIWEGGHRVPMIVSWPGHTPAGKVCERLIGQIDILASVAAVVGCKLPSGCGPDSLDQSSLWQDPSLPAIRHELVHNTYKDRYALRSEQWLYLDVANGDERKLPPWYAEMRGYPNNSNSNALFDLSQDLEQLHDVAKENPNIVIHLKNQLEQIRTQSK